MSQIKIVSFKFFIFILLLLCYSGCSDNKKEPTVTSIVHSENWIVEHNTADKAKCMDCHGIDYKGGGAEVSCYSASYKEMSCHPNGFHSVNENWTANHGSAYSSDKTGCADCHGSDYKGGDSKVGCSLASLNGVSCHTHPSGWMAYTDHGKSAKASYGFSKCQKCHGEDFAGGIVNISCFTCHGVNAPHKKAPWNDTTTPIAHHNRTDSTKSVDKSNLAVCVICHANGRYSDKKPDTTKAVGTELGCDNNTICHSKKW